jgi:hypothetical protein
LQEKFASYRRTPFYWKRATPREVGKLIKHLLKTILLKNEKRKYKY